MRTPITTLVCLCELLTFAVGDSPLSLHAAERAGTAFHVCSGGNDAWSGRLAEPNEAKTDGPFGSIARAQRTIRELRLQKKLAGPVTVRIRGVHRLCEPLVFTPTDSGTAESPVTYTGYRGQKPVLSGGRVIGGWTKGQGQLWTAQLPQVKAGNWYFRQLFVDGKRIGRARTPNQGYLRVDSLVDPKPGTRWNKGVDRFRFKPGDIRDWSDLKNVEVVVFHSWNTSRVRIASVDKTKSIVTFASPTVFRPLAWDPEQRYYVENARELLDSPGEWYLDRQTGTLTYWPPKGQDPNRVEVVAPVLSELVRFDGDADSGKLIEHVRLTGISLQHADWTLADTGYGDPQAAVSVPAAVSASGVRHVILSECEIAHIGTYGVWFSRGCKKNQIVHNHIHDLGAGGVRIGEAKMPQSDAVESSNNLVSNNYIHDGGHVYPAGVGFWLAQSSHNVISHNEIHSFNYSGMSVGWNWSDAPTRTLHNTIEHNHVHHVVRGMLSDGGGIYTLGTQTGTVIRNNIFHDIFPYMGKPAMAWGIYMDQGSNGLLIENNIVYNTVTGGIMNTGMMGNVVRNNIFAFSAWQAAWRWKWQKDPPSVVERNIFYLTQGDLFRMDGGRTDFRSKWDYNLYWRTDGEPLTFYDKEFSEWQAKGADQHGLVADPRFVDPARYDFRLQADSPALKLGFKPIDTSRNGLFGPPQWACLPGRTVFPPTVLPPLPPPPPPVSVNDDFEKTPVGAPPALAKVYEEARGDSLRVTDELAAGGKRCLKFTDAPGLKHSWDPHMHYSPHFRKGLATLRFDMRLEKGARVGHEWRDAGSPYDVGPTMIFQGDGKLLVGGKHLADVPAGEWFRVAIECHLGKKAAGSYDLTLTLPGQSPKTYRAIPCGTPKFKGLQWLGFTSLATEKTVFYLDNVRLKLEVGDRKSKE